MSEGITQFQPTPAHPSTAVPGQPGSRAPSLAAPRLRVWPGLVIVVLMWAAIMGPGLIPGLEGSRIQVDAMLYGAMLGGVAVGLWWLLASRAPWTDRLLILLFFATSGTAALQLSHSSFKYMFYGPIVRGMPIVTATLVAWLWLTGALPWPIRRLGAVVAMLLAWGYCCLLRFDGVYGDFQAQISWRWQQTEEERNAAELEQAKSAGKANPKEKALLARAGDWPSFRGTDRDSRLTHYRIDTNAAARWKAEPPKKLWAHNIGPGWSSFAVVGDRIFTQEQRKKNFEAVVCYDANTGEQLWEHTDPGRFEEVAGGVGPRATPTFVDGYLYCLGANGKLNCLDALTGKVKWTRDLVEDSGAEIPRWGFSSSPLVVKGIVTVFAGGPDGHSMLGYHASTGEIAWSKGDGRHTYCSPHLENIDGVEQIAIATENGVTSYEPTEGQVLWQYEWALGKQGARVAQPIQIGAADVLVGTPMAGARRVRISHAGNSWGNEQVWETKDIKPYFNDLVIYQDHAYGFDGNLLTCVSLADGKGTWRARNYGNGQALLLADQGLLLVSTERGEVALVEAKPEKHVEIGRFRALDANKGKTWNHPVIAHGKLFIRNDAEVACFQLAEEKSDKKDAATKDKKGTSDK
jgi:outer membrane protein assembly factor BamB